MQTRHSPPLNSPCATPLLIAALLALAAFVPASHAATLNYAGAQTDLGSGWRTSSVSKPLDIDGDNVLGTDGYYVVNRPQVPPFYVDSMTNLGTIFPGNGGYALIDDPTNLPALFQSGTMNPNPGAGVSTNIFQFTLNGSADGRTIRVGLMVDNLDIAQFNAISLTLVQTNGVGVTNGPVATTAPIHNDRIPDWIFFDITGAVAGDTFIIQGTAGVEATATLGGVSFDSIASPRAHPDYALSFDGMSNYVSVSLASPPTNNYTLSGWVNLNSGSVYFGQRAAMLGGTNCGDSIEFMIRPQTDNPADPQYLELGRCGLFDGVPSTSPVPLNAWTHVAVTIDASQNITYYINGNQAGSWSDPDDDFSLGTTIRLADNNPWRLFNGLLADVQIWNRVLSQSEIQTYMNQEPTGIETGLYAFYPFNEGTGSSTADLAAAAGGSTGALVLNPAWIPLAQVVTNSADSGPGTLRDTLAAPFPGTEMLFDPSLSGATIDLTSGEILLTSDVTIDGSALAGGIQINGTANSRVFAVAANTTVEMNDLTITNGDAIGDAGGGILNVGTLTLNVVTMSGNTSTYEGGGIENGGVLTVNNSTFYSNFAGYGGGAIDNNALLAVVQSTLFGNSVDAGDGSGIWAGGSNFFINCTVVGNQTTDGASGIGEYGPGPIIMTNCIVALNANNDFGGSYTGTGNFIGGDPLLAALGNYGGPTLTMPPLAGSPAVDAGSDSVTNLLATDQRGLPRLSGRHVDIGAVELQSVQVTTSADFGAGSLRAVAVGAAPGSIVTFAPGLSGSTITLTNGVITLNNNLAIDGTALPGGIGISGNAASGIFSVNSGALVSFAGLTLTNGNQYDGGAIYSAGGSSVTVSRCTLTRNFAVEGGALCNDGPVVLNECTIASNFASYGGAIECRAPLTVSQCTISGNNGFYGGGGLYIINTPTSVNNSIISGNIEEDGTGHDMDIFIVYGALAYTNANIVQYVDEYEISTPTTGPAPIAAAPLLSALGNYGGPTPTLLPLPASPAVDAGSDNAANALTIDQRGYPRLSGMQVDIGAVELQQATVATLPASGIAGLFATGNAVAAANDLATTWYFQYGTDTSYGAYSTTNGLAAGFSPVVVSNLLASLTPGVTYHFQALANDGVSVKAGGDETFTTLGIGTAARLDSVHTLNNGVVQFAFTNLTGASFTVYASTNVALPLSQWTNLGVALEAPAASGQYQFTDPQATNWPHRFYRVHSP